MKGFTALTFTPTPICSLTAPRYAILVLSDAVPSHDESGVRFTAGTNGNMFTFHLLMFSCSASGR